MATLATNLVSCSAVNSKRLCGFGLWERILAYYRGIGFLVVNHMLPESLLFVFGTPFVRCNMWPGTVCTFGLFCLFFGHPLCE